MPDQPRYEPSPLDRERAQVALYEATDGSEGNTLEGRPIIILTHIGQKSGLLRKSPLMRIEHEGSYAVIASNGGAARDPLWAFNIAANPEVRVQDGPTTRALRARRVLGDELELWWTRAYETFPKFAGYRRAAEREVPVYVLEPV
ncbi:nitroreductase family deazaflavin-dependent oxidoreductase [Mycolicibacterium sp.]|uniref:nitroreductase family deazaflavin-dependent oxidoreductase n=1 Tax=Mycolicibacterium sp. TaxID=2320850 RepID=UPI001A20EE29|nr:nitroreductase family deazaflavin-dependent oxidoreductase [Mycolicibacterium sp.]MBJ7341870.1 nitroreductase family deazaflavin-dependent oxidoreductase [Mycolicibacterium sp.]